MCRKWGQMMGDLTRPKTTKGWFSMGYVLFSGKSRLVKYGIMIWPEKWGHIFLDFVFLGQEFFWQNCSSVQGAKSRGCCEQICLDSTLGFV